jgi:hypothetical protein
LSSLEAFKIKNYALIPAAIDWNTRLLTSPTFELTIMPSNLNLKQTCDEFWTNFYLHYKNKNYI